MQVAAIGEEEGNGLRKGAFPVQKAITQGGQEPHPSCMQGVGRLLRGLGYDPFDVLDGEHISKFYFLLFNASSFFNTALFPSSKVTCNIFATGPLI
jgi:hypothetical protein